MSIFGKLPLVLIEHGPDAKPTHRWGWVGTIPGVLCDKVEPRPGDIMAGRTQKDPSGKHWTIRPRCYATKKAALADAKKCGVTVDSISPRSKR